MSMTCGLIEHMDSHLGDMDEHGLPEEDKQTINDVMDKLYDMNKKYVRLSKDGKD